MSRPLHAVFSELLHDEATRQAYAADPAGLLDAAGHPDLPADLVDEAVVSYADTAPPAVAEHLAPFVMAHSQVTESSVDQAELDGLALLATAPIDTTGDDVDVDLPGSVDTVTEARGEAGSPPDDIDFGAGIEHGPTHSEADTFDDTLSEIAAGGMDEPVGPAPMGDGDLLGHDPALEVDDTEPDEDFGPE